MDRNLIWIACVAALCAAPLKAQEATQQVDETAKAGTTKKLETITVTGSLIPQSSIETASPVTTITADDIKARGYTSVADALQQSAFASGSVQNAQFANGFTPGAKTLSLFGLSVGFTKYLIDGRPMGDFPALYNGSQSFNNISGIPMNMVERIDILPGGQSSLYGSDAIAGVVNIILKKKIDVPTVDLQFGWTTGGGGASRRVGFTDGFSRGRFNVVAGAQFESQQPMWGFDRDLTSHPFSKGTTAPAATRDFLVFGSRYAFPDKNNCTLLTNLNGGSEQKQYRQNKGDYCGSFNTPGYRTLMNDQKSANIYAHSTYDVADHLQLYGNILANYEEQKYFSSPGFWGTQTDKLSYYDGSLRKNLDLQRSFAPEEFGGLRNNMSKDYDAASLIQFGGKGRFGESEWEYDVGFSHSEDKLEMRAHSLVAGAADNYFVSHVLGPQLGIDAASGKPIYNPDYAAFYKPMSRGDFRSISTDITAHAKTWDNLIRGQLTNSALFSLPGGDAGLAVVAEVGNQGWSYVPDPRILADEIWGRTDVSGAGHRSRYAATSELRMPLLKQLTLDIAGRWDNYHVDSSNIHHGTFNLGLEYRPFDSLLLRSRYGNAFKAPTLADEFQGKSGFYSFVPDYLNCQRLGFDPDHVSDCPIPYDRTGYKGSTSGNPKLQPITATVWTYGLVWAPVERMSVSVDYFHWGIENEVRGLGAGYLSILQYQCETGSKDMSSEECRNSFALIKRKAYPDDPKLLGIIESAQAPKVNISNETVNSIVASFSYGIPMGRLGSLSLNASYNDILKHSIQAFPSDPPTDIFRAASSDFKSKVNGSATWTPNKSWSTTVYFNRYGSTPNIVAEQNGNFSSAGSGRLPAWILYNASVTYNPSKKLSLSLKIDNVFNKMPPVDRGFTGLDSTPYVASKYNVYGRSTFLEMNYKLGTPQ